VGQQLRARRRQPLGRRPRPQLQLGQLPHRGGGLGPDGFDFGPRLRHGRRRLPMLSPLTRVPFVHGLARLPGPAANFLEPLQVISQRRFPLHQLALKLLEPLRRGLDFLPKRIEPFLFLLVSALQLDAARFQGGLLFRALLRQLGRELLPLGQLLGPAAQLLLERFARVLGLEQGGLALAQRLPVAR
jgi:hypothetical protein